MAGQGLFQQIAGLQYAENMLKAIPADHDPRKPGFDDSLASGFVAFFEVDHKHLAARRHDGGDFLLIQAQHVGDDFLLALVEDAGLGALFHQHLDLVIGDGRLFLAPGAKDAQDRGRRTGKHDNQRVRHPGQHHHRPGNQRCNAFRRQHGQVLGHQFADHNRKVGQGHDGDCQRNTPGVRLDQGNAGERCGQRVSQRGFTDCPAQDADGGDADLNRGQEAGRFLMQGEGGFGAQAAIVGKVLQPRFARGNDGHFRHGENAIDKNQCNEKEYIHG